MTFISENMSGNKQYTIKHIEISEELLEYLSPVLSRSYSRCDAFYDLVVRASTFNGSLTHLGYEFDLLPGEFIVTVTELAKAWGWERRRTRNFIEELQKLDVLQIVPFKKFYQVDMVALRFKRVDEQSPILKDLDSHEIFINEPLVDINNDSLKYRGMSIATSESSVVEPFTDSMGHNLYSAEQRMEVARTLSSLAVPLTSRLLSAIYSPRVEKYMLDTFYKRSNGNVSQYLQALRGNIDGSDEHTLCQIGKVTVDTLAEAIEMLSAAISAPKATNSTTKPSSTEKKHEN